MAVAAGVAELPPIPTYDSIDNLARRFDDFDEDVRERQAFWILTRAQLEKLVAQDKALKGFKPSDPVPLVARMYVAYTKIVQELDKVWAETYQYQKSMLMRKILDAAYSRMLELKEALTELELTEFHYIDNQLIEVKIIPHDMEILKLSSIPVHRNEQLQQLALRLYQGERIFIPPEPIEEEEEEGEITEEILERREREKEIREREKKDREKKEEKERRVTARRPMAESIDPKKELIKQAVLLIQKHERARIGRLDFFDEKTMFELRKVYFQPKPIPLEISVPAAIKIQAAWRGYRVRRENKRRNDKLRILIRMDRPSTQRTSFEELEAQDFLKKRRKREQKAQQFIEANLQEKERIVRVVQPGLMEDIGDEIRAWFRYWYDVALTFDKIPPEEKGGTILVIRGETLTPEEYRIEIERKRREKEKLKNNPALAKKAKEEAEKKKKDAAEKAKKEKERQLKEKKLQELQLKKGVREPFSFKDSPALNKMDMAEDEYDFQWTHQDEEMVKNDDPLMYKITDEKCYEVQLEARKIVDEMMRAELELLQDAHMRDRHSKKKGKKKKKKKKAKVKRVKKKKGKKDPTGHRSVEDLFQELYDNGIIRKYPQIDLEKYIGEYSYKNLELRLVDMDPLPSVGDIRQVIINNCIIPLGAQMLPKPRSVCIAGPIQSGKHLLAYAICTETDSVLFDLSPSVTYKCYPGKKNLKMMIHLVNKMSRILQPSIIFIDGAEKLFYTKIPKQERKLQQNPRRLKKQLPKGIVKAITPQDRVMVLGITHQPWAGKAKPMMKTYEKIIMIPRTDYGTVFNLWMDILMSFHGISRTIDVSAIAKLSVGYPIPYIREIANKVLCPKRIIRFKFDPLRLHEILEGFMRGSMPEPIPQKIQDKFTKWLIKKNKMAKLRHKIISKKREERENVEKIRM